MVLHYKGIILAKEKRIKTAVVRARISDKKKKALKEYCDENDITVSKLIDDFLVELLKDRLKD